MHEPDRLRQELHAACEDAGVAPASVVAYVVQATRPTGTTPLAYLHPAGAVQTDTVAVFRAVGAERAARHAARAHRLAIWAELPGIPDCALGPMLRHELEHARRWERSGTRFFEADDLLRGALRANGGHVYALIPSEIEANSASAAYASRTLSPGDLAAVRDCDECAGLLAPRPVPEDVVAATLEELAAMGAWGPEGDEKARYLDGVERACAAWDEAAAAEALANGRSGPEIELV